MPRLPPLVGIRRLVLVFVRRGLRAAPDHVVHENPHTLPHIVIAVCLVDCYARQHDEGVEVHVDWLAQPLRYALDLVLPDGGQCHERFSVHRVSASFE